MSYGEWMKQADRHCAAISGVSINDLADGASRDAFDDGVSPEDYAEELLANEGFPVADYMERV